MYSNRYQKCVYIWKIGSFKLKVLIGCIIMLKLHPYNTANIFMMNLLFTSFTIESE